MFLLLPVLHRFVFHLHELWMIRFLFNNSLAHILPAQMEKGDQKNIFHCSHVIYNFSFYFSLYLCVNKISYHFPKWFMFCFKSCCSFSNESPTKEYECLLLKKKMNVGRVKKSMWFSFKEKNIVIKCQSRILNNVSKSFGMQMKNRFF